MKSTDFSRTQTCVLSLPLTVCSWGKAAFSPDLNLLICEMGVRIAPAHLVLLGQAPPQGRAEENAGSLPMTTLSAIQRTKGKLHVKAAESGPRGTVFTLPVSPDGDAVPALAGGVLTFLTSWLQRLLRRLVLKTSRKF